MAGQYNTAQGPSIHPRLSTTHINTPPNLGHQAAHTLLIRPTLDTLPSVPQRLYALGQLRAGLGVGV